MRLFLYLYLQFYSCFQLGLGVNRRQSSFAFNATPLDGKNEGPGKTFKTFFTHSAFTAYNGNYPRNY